MTFSLGRIQPSTGTSRSDLAGEKINRAPAADAGKRRIEVALVIHRQDHGPVLDEALAMNNPETKEDPGDQPGEMIDREIPGVHRGNR